MRFWGLFRGLCNSPQNTRFVDYSFTFARHIEFILMKTPRPKKERVPLNDPIFERFPQFRKLVGDIRPRTSQDICLLCLGNTVSKIESHIIPGFLTKSIFKDPKKRRMVVTNGINIRRIKPSSPKELYLLCDGCEGKLAALERLVSIVLPKTLEEIRKAPNLSAGGFHIQLQNLHPSLFHLFVYSILWRAEVCQQKEFASLAVSSGYAELLRHLLDACLSTKQEIMIKSFQDYCPCYLPIDYQVITFSQQPKRESRMIFGIGYDYDSSDGYRVFANEMNFIFTDKSGLKQNAFTYVNEILAINATEWETITGSAFNTMVEMNKHIVSKTKK
jgi:hypothetical protein